MFYPESCSQKGQASPVRVLHLFFVPFPKLKWGRRRYFTSYLSARVKLTTFLARKAGHAEKFQTKRFLVYGDPHILSMTVPTTISITMFVATPPPDPLAHTRHLIHTLVLCEGSSNRHPLFSLTALHLPDLFCSILRFHPRLALARISVSVSTRFAADVLLLKHQRARNQRASVHCDRWHPGCQLHAGAASRMSHPGMSFRRYSAPVMGISTVEHVYDSARTFFSVFFFTMQPPFHRYIGGIWRIDAK